MQLLKVVLALVAITFVPSEGSELAAAVKEAVAVSAAAESEGGNRLRGGKCICSGCCKTAPITMLQAEQSRRLQLQAEQSRRLQLQQQ